MKFKFRLAALTLAAALAAATSQAATVYSFSLTRLFGSVASTGTKITDIAADSANQVWFTTNQYGVTALSNNAVARGFPLYSTLSSAGFTPAISSIAFGPAGTEKQENFFLGANGTASGVLYGRMLETGPSFTNDHTLNDELTAKHATTKVNAMSVDGEERIWIATDKGVTWVSLPSLEVNATLYAPTVADTNVLRVVNADSAKSGGQAFFSTINRLYMVNPSSINHWLYFDASTDINGIGGFDVDADGNLWVAESTSSSPTSKYRKIYKFLASELMDWSGGGPQPTPIEYAFDPGDTASAFSDTRKINVLKISPSTGDIWLGTSAGAFFQKPDPLGMLSPKLCANGSDFSSSLDDIDGLGQSCVGAGAGWRPTPQADSETVLAVGESFEAIFLDQLGNAWLGSNKYVRAIITRNLTLNGTRFIGTGSVAKVQLYDEQITDPEAVVTVKVQTAEEALLMTKVSDGRYSLKFGFTTSNAATPEIPPHKFTVNPSSENDIVVSYTYTDVLDETHTISLQATWVEIAPFEDDLLIGGPCAIQALDR